LFIFAATKYLTPSMKSERDITKFSYLQHTK
jgi:hypothetical protein